MPQGKPQELWTCIRCRSELIHAGRLGLGMGIGFGNAADPSSLLGPIGLPLPHFCLPPTDLPGLVGISESEGAHGKTLAFLPAGSGVAKQFMVLSQQCMLVKHTFHQYWDWAT